MQSREPSGSQEMDLSGTQAWHVSFSDWTQWEAICAEGVCPSLVFPCGHQHRPIWLLMVLCMADPTCANRGGQGEKVSP